MKLLFSILILTIFGVCFTQNDYVTMSSAQFRNNAVANQLRESGIQLVLAQAVELNVIQAANFVLTSTSNVASRSSGSFDFYRYNVTLTNPNDDIFITSFVMRYNTNTEASDLFTRSWRIEFANATSSAPAYIPLDSSEFNTPFIQELANFGKDWIAARAIRIGWITEGDYYIVAIHYVQRQDLVDGANYQIGINFKKDGDTEEVKAGFRIKYVTSNGSKSVEAFSYTMVPSSTPVEEEVIIPPPVEEEVIIPPPVEEEVIIPPPVEEEVIIPPPVEEEVIIPPPVEEEVIIPPPVEEEVIVDDTVTPNDGANNFGFSTRPGL